MKGAGLPRLYDVLTPEERFRLMLTARAREDEPEVDRLERTCPSKGYTMPDATYLDRRELIQPITLAVCLDLTQYLAKLQVSSAFGDAARELRERFLDRAEVVVNQLQTHAADEAEADQAEDWREASSLLVGHALDSLERVANTLDRDLACEARVVLDGFGRFCRAELGLEPEMAMGALFAPMLERLEWQREALDVAEPDPAKVDEYARTLTEGWRRVLGLEQPRAAS